MGILSSLRRRRQAYEYPDAAPGGLWRSTGEGVTEWSDGEQSDEGDQFGDSYGIAYWNPVLGGCQITVRYYAVQYASWAADEWRVEQCIEWSIAERPGDEPSWQQSQTRLVGADAIYDFSARSANALAEQYAYEDDCDAAAVEHARDWDGQPFEFAEDEGEG